MREKFSISDGSGCKNVIIFRVDNSSSAHAENRKKDILILCKGTTQGLDATKLTVETEYFIKFSEDKKIFP